MEQVGVVIYRLVKIANTSVKEMEANPNARDFQARIVNFKNLHETIVALRDPDMTDESWTDVRVCIESSLKCTDPFKDLKRDIYSVRWIQDNRIHTLKEQI